jgi:hypothetical protein
VPQSVRPTLESALLPLAIRRLHSAMSSLKLGKGRGVMPKLLQDVLGRNADTEAFERLGSVFLLLRRAAPDPLHCDGSGFLIGSVRVEGFLNAVLLGRHL